MKANYDHIFAQILDAVPHGKIAENVMEVLKKNGLVEGEPTKIIEWLFNFEGGGWNSVVAVNKEQAIKIIKKNYAGDGVCIPDLTTVRPTTNADYEANMRNFD